MPGLRSRSAAFALIVGVLAQSACIASAADLKHREASIAFVDVAVVSMTRDTVVEHQTVLIDHGEIIAMGPSAVIDVPPKALRIPGSGRYLMPGLIDMTVHFRRQPSADDVAYSQFPDYRERNDDMGVLFVANGVTSVRQTHGHPAGDELMRRSRGQWLGPTIYSTGPITDGSPPTHPFLRVLADPKDAARLVAEDKAKGYVAVKVYDGLSRPAYEAIVAAAAAAKIDVVGKVPESVGLAGVIAAHQATIENIDVLLYSLQPGPYAPNPNTSWHDLFQRTDFSKLTDFADQMRREGIWSCPAITLGQFDAPDYERSPETKYMPAAFRAALREHWSDEPPYDEDHAFALAVVRRLHERGVGLLLGTDSYLVVPGFSAIRELEYFVEAGLTPLEALKTGTINAARALHEQDMLGTVDVGKRADLILLQDNPLADIANARKIVGVTLRGRWLPESELTERLTAIAKAVAAP